jgi:hypothetical protein
MTQAAVPRPGVAACCLRCGRPVGPAERRCPAFALAGVAAPGGCCGGCATGPARLEPAAGAGVAA